MRTWFWTLFLLVVAVSLAVVLNQHGGNVILVMQPWRIQVSTTFAVLLLIALFVAIYVGLRLLGWLISVPERMRDWRGRRAQKRDHELLERGWVGLLEGRFLHAERDLTRLFGQTKVSGRKVLAALSAARAAHGLGEFSRRDSLLAQAQEYVGKDQGLQQALATVTADMLLDQGRFEDALAQLEPLQDGNSRHLHVARLLLRAHDSLGHHEQVFALARSLSRRGMVGRDEASAMIDRAGAALLRNAQGEQWHAVWKDFKSEERVLPNIALAAAAAFDAEGKPDDAARTLEAAIAYRRQPELLAAYARCDADQVPRRLEKAETWLQKQPDNPDLLSALGVLCLIGQIWGTAERYLQRSLQYRKDARAHALLGSLYDRLDRAELSSSHWRQATAVSMALPVLAADAPLPAADTRDDPILADADDLSELTPFALGGAAVVSQGQAAAQRPVAPPAADVPLVVTPDTDVDEFFDSAPIPGYEPISESGDSDNHSNPSTQGSNPR